MAKLGSSVLTGTTHPRWFGAFGAAAALIGLIGAFIGYDATRSEPTKTSTAVGGLGTLVVALAAVVVVGMVTRRQVKVTGEGIESGAPGGKPARILWSEAHDFYYRAIVGSGGPVVEKVTVRTEDGRRIDVDNMSIQGNPNAGVPKVVEQYSTAANWPKIQARLLAGDEVSFGAVSMSRHRITIGALTYSLDRSVTLQIEQGKLKVGAEGKWVTSDVGVCDVANYPCLLKAIGQVAQALPPG